MNALFSVSDKFQIEVLAKAAIEYGFNLISSGGTYSYLSNMGFQCLQI